MMSFVNFILWFVSVPACENKGDFIFLLDSSGSIGPNFKKEKDFVKKFVDTMSDSSRAGVIAFSKNVVNGAEISNYKSKESFIKIVNDLPLMGSTTRLDKALDMARQQLTRFAKKDFSTPKVVLLITDGSQTPDFDVTDVAAIGKEIRALGARLFTIGIGNGIKEKELYSIAGYPNDVFFASHFNEFKSQAFLKRISAASCNAGMFSLNRCISVITGYCFVVPNCSRTVNTTRARMLKWMHVYDAILK